MIVVVEGRRRSSPGDNGSDIPCLGGRITAPICLCFRYHIADARRQAVNGQAFLVLEGERRGDTAGKLNRAFRTCSVRIDFHGFKFILYRRGLCAR